MGREFLSRFMIVFLAIVVMTGCAADDERSAENTLLKKLEVNGTMWSVYHANWVQAETGGVSPEWNAGGVVDWDVCREVAARVHSSTYFWEGKPTQEWQTSAQTADSRRGVCTDIAILIYIRLREAGIPDENLKMVQFMNLWSPVGHMACCIVDDRGYNYLSGSGFMGWNVAPEGMQAYFMCDLWGFWVY